MISAKECLRHAARCEYMASTSRDPESKTNWGGMAQRWIERARPVDEPNPCTHSRVSKTLRREPIRALIWRVSPEVEHGQFLAS
jgi:hypothetical protein